MCRILALRVAVIPAKAGIYSPTFQNALPAEQLDSRFRGNDRRYESDLFPKGTNTCGGQSAGGDSLQVSTHYCTRHQSPNWLSSQAVFWTLPYATVLASPWKLAKRELYNAHTSGKFRGPRGAPKPAPPSRRAAALPPALRKASGFAVKSASLHPRLRLEG
jgi:hypothetical protein